MGQGWLPEGSKPVSWNSKQVGDIFASNPGLALYLWGSNSRADSARAKKLGWKSSGPDFWTQLPEDVKIAVQKANARA